jgi:crotonobetainyl-CoA:carnitine CoA-transferase CaiB-like acyl-CoA transferase
MAAVVPRLAGTPGGVTHAGHRVGQDTRPVLRERLGLSDERIDALAAAGVVCCDAAATKGQPA